MFYIIKDNSDRDIIGSDYPQCVGLIKGYDNSNANSVSNFSLHKGKRVLFEPELDGIKLDAKAKLTDFISCGLGPGNDSIVSQLFVCLLKNYRTSPMQFFNCTLYQKSQAIEYTWLHYIYDLESKVDYQRSEFTHPDETLLEKIKQINSYAAFENFYNNQDRYGLIRSEKIVLTSAALDFFTIGRFNQKHYVSDKLKKEMEAAGITGVDFVKADDVLFVS